MCYPTISYSQSAPFYNLHRLLFAEAIDYFLTEFDKKSDYDKKTFKRKRQLQLNVLDLAGDNILYHTQMFYTTNVCDKVETFDLNLRDR